MYHLYPAEQHTDWLSCASRETATTEESVAGPYLFERTERSRTLSFAQQLRQIKLRHNPLNTIGKVQVCIQSPALIVPMAEFDETISEVLYNFTLYGQPEAPMPQRVFYDVLPVSNAVVLFAEKEHICKVIEQEMGEVYYVSVFTGLLKWMARHGSPAQQKRLFIHCRSHHIDVAYVAGRRIFAFNSFEVQTATDVVYFSNKLAEQFNLDPHTTPFIVCGIEGKTQVVAGALQDYIEQVDVIDPALEFDEHPLTRIPMLPFELLTQILG